MSPVVRSVAWGVCFAAMAFASACHRCSPPAALPAQRPTAEAHSISQAQSAGEAVGASAPLELLTDAFSPYIAGLAMEDDAIYLLTDRVAHRIVPGQSKEQIPIENGTSAAVTRTDIVYWSHGAIWAVPKSGGKTDGKPRVPPRRLASFEHQPQSFMASGDVITWLDMPAPDRFAIQTLDDRGVRTLFFHPARIETAAMDSTHVFFVRREGATGWSISSVAVHGGELRQGSVHGGPSPAKLGVAGDVFYYDLESGELRRVSRDLSREEALARDLICSPLAAATTIVCANIEGLFELEQRPGARPALLSADRRRIANVAVNARFVAWLSDAGRDQLSLMMVPVAAKPAR